MGDSVVRARQGPRLLRRWSAVLLVISAISTIAVVVDRRGQIRELEHAGLLLTRAVQAQQRLDAQKRGDELHNFAEEDFPSKYEHVTAADRATDEAYRRWNSVPGTQFSTVRQTIQKCYGAVDTYNVVAAQYPADLFTSIAPAQIDLSDPQTDCGRAFVSAL